MSAYTDELEQERSMKDQFMARHPESPFVQDAVVGFRGLRYFPPDEKFVVSAVLKRSGTPEEAFLRTNRDGQSVVRYLGVLQFTIGGRALQLRVYHAGEGVGTSVFVPFRDGTSGSDTYGAGRYLTLELTEDDRYELDFNRAFNPYCAYTDEYECSFPPAENDLPIRIAAGEKVWSRDRNPATPSTAVLELTRGPKVTASKKGPARSAPGRKPAAQRKSRR